MLSNNPVNYSNKQYNYAFEQSEQTQREQDSNKQIISPKTKHLSFVTNRYSIHYITNKVNLLEFIFKEKEFN